MIRVVAAAALTVGLVAYPVLRPSDYQRLLILVGAVSVLGIAMAVFTAWPQAVGWGIAGLLLEYGFSLVGDPGIDPGAPLYAAALLVLGELSVGIAGERGPEGTGRHRCEARRLTITALAGAAVSGLVLLAAWFLGEQGLFGQLVGVAAAGAALVTLVTLVQRRLSPRP